MSNTIKFFAFGCWNLRGCQGNKYLNANIVNIMDSNYEFGVILGDNIYRDKANGEKEYNIYTLLDGMACINKIQAPLYITLGNHDVEECRILRYQLNQAVADIPAIDLSNWIIPHNFYSKIIRKNDLSLKLIVIDTNMLQGLVANYEPQFCDVGPKVTTGAGLMLDFLKAEIASAVGNDWIIIAGHVPLASIKEKKAAKVQRVTKLYFETILQAIYKSPYREKIIYICADTHNFQHDLIRYDEYTLHQFVLGTGGASPDIINTVSVGETLDIYPDTSEYKITLAEYYKPYGFAEFHMNKDVFRVSYNAAVPIN